MSRRIWMRDVPPDIALTVRTLYGLKKGKRNDPQQLRPPRPLHQSKTPPNQLAASWLPFLRHIRNRLLGGWRLRLVFGVRKMSAETEATKITFIALYVFWCMAAMIAPFLGFWGFGFSLLSFWPLIYIGIRSTASASTTATPPTHPPHTAPNSAPPE